MKKGDVVQLKSGSLKMTIEDVKEEGYVICMWFDGQGDLKREKFHKDLLRIWQPPKIRYRSI